MRKKVSIALGTFDGLHIGHRAVLDAALAAAHGAESVAVKGAESTAAHRSSFAEMHCEETESAVGGGAGGGSVLPVAVTFRVPPSQTKSEGIIMSSSQKADKLRESGFAVKILDFVEVRDMSAEEFLDRLFSENDVVAVSCGFNYRFGKGAKGDTDLLKEYCAEKGAACNVCEPVMFGGSPVSSTRIRKALTEGRIEEANGMLGYDYGLSAEVIHGDARGRTIGFPTINQIPEDGLVVPKYGVYRSSVTVDGKEYPAMTNVGIRPTFRLDRPVFETNIIDFDKDVYGMRLTVSLKKYIREEKEFASLDELKAAIGEDVDKCR